jgi:branched-subunit amino acid ABC-type transport system permease component
MTYLITQTLNGLFSAGLLFLIASGLTLAFGVMRIVNIAHGSFYMLGVYVAYSVILRTGSLLLGALAAIVVVGLVGFVMQRFFLRLAEQNAAFAVKVADYVHVMSKGTVVHSSDLAALWENEDIKTQLLGVPSAAGRPDGRI